MTNLPAFSSWAGSSSGSPGLAFKNVAFEQVLFFCDKAGLQDTGEVTATDAVMSQCSKGRGMDTGSVKGCSYWTNLAKEIWGLSLSKKSGQQGRNELFVSIFLVRLPVR